MNHSERSTYKANLMDISGFDSDLNKKPTPFTDSSSLRKTTCK